MVSYADPDTFQHNLQKGQNPSHRGYPNNWQPPHFHGDNIYNPHLRILMSEPDGTREYYDPVTTTHSYEHASGYHKAILTDSVVENVPNRKVSYVGGGGHSETIDGHHDITRGGHYRENNQGDTYTNTKGVSHSFSGQGSVSICMGNSTEENYGNKKTRIMGENGAHGVGVGPGDGNNHDNAQTITNKRIYTRAYTSGDIWNQTSSNNINHQAGTNFNVQAEENVSMHSKGGYAIIKGGKIYLVGQVMVQGDLQVSGNIQMASANTPILYATTIYQESGGAGGGTAPNINAPSPAALDSGEVS